MKSKILRILTLSLPLPIYLFLNAVLFSVTPDVTINAKIEDIQVINYIEKDTYFIYSNETTTFEGGYTVLFNGMIGTVIESGDIIRIGYTYYDYTENKEGVKELVNLKLIEKQQSYKIPVAFFISALGVLIVALVVMGKMDIMKTYPRISALIALSTGTLVLYIIDTIVSNLLGVFIVATVSWAIYCIEYTFAHGKITKTEKEKKTNDLTALLKAALNE